MSKDIKKALEHCVEWKCDNCPNGDDLGSGEIVCRGRLLPQVLEYVADLEAKLEQSQKERELDNSFWKQECDSLQKSLAEKEKEIEEMHKQLSYCESLLVRECKECDNKFKTDFAIDQLLIARSRVYNFRYNESRCLNKEDSIEDCLEILDQQIKELKHENKGE